MKPAGFCKTSCQALNACSPGCLRILSQPLTWFLAPTLHHQHPPSPILLYHLLLPKAFGKNTELPSLLFLGEVFLKTRPSVRPQRRTKHHLFTSQASMQGRLFVQLFLEEIQDLEKLPFGNHPLLVPRTQQRDCGRKQGPEASLLHLIPLVPISPPPMLPTILEGSLSPGLSIQGLLVAGPTAQTLPQSSTNEKPKHREVKELLEVTQPGSG